MIMGVEKGKEEESSIGMLQADRVGLQTFIMVHVILHYSMESYLQFQTVCSHVTNAAS